MEAMTNIKFNGRSYNRSPESSLHSDRSYFKCMGRSLHRDIYAYHHGTIPQGFQIHHIDGNPLNNDISNLEALTPAEHGKKHRGVCSDKKRENLANIRHMTKAWHKSPEGRQWHSEHARRSQAAMAMVECQCKQCGETYEVKLNMKSRSKWCSNKCKQRNQRARKSA